MGGELFVESEKEKGSKFSFSIKLPEAVDYVIENVKNKKILNSSSRKKQALFKLN